MDDVEIIKTKTVGKDFAKTTPVVLEQTATTALAFYPEIHPGGVRGHIVRLKKNKNEPWEEIPEKDFRKLNVYEGVKIELGTQQLETLITEVRKRQELAKAGIQSGINEFVIADKDKALILDNSNIKGILEQVLERGYSDDFWDLVKSSDPHLADKLSAGHLQWRRQEVVNELQERLQGKFAETKGDDSWQSWVYRNNWLFGTNYQKPIEKQKINLSGIMPDYLFPTVDGFIDILEIKLPDFEVIEEDKNHKGSWVWSKESNHAIGQVVNYLCEIDRLRLEIERLIGSGVSILKPRAYILIGNSKDWSKEKKEGLRKLNHALHGIEIITYHDLVNRGLAFIESKAEQETAQLTSSPEELSPPMAKYR